MLNLQVDKPDKTPGHNIGLALGGHFSKLECMVPNKHLSCRQILLRKPAQRQAENAIPFRFPPIVVKT